MSQKVSRGIIYTLLLTISLCALGVYRLNQLNQTPLHPDNFSAINKIEIYALGLIMSTLAYPIYPEVAREHLMLYRSFEGKPKVIEDDFFLESRVVRDALAQSQKSGGEVRLYWPVGAYALSLERNKYWESRIALALNGGWISVQDGVIRVRVPIAYPKRAFAPLITIPGLGTLGVQEGLFNILQQVGWYHTGEVYWIASAKQPPNSSI